MWSIRSWDKARKEVKHYKRRQPEKTALYRIVSQYLEELPIIWEDRFQPTYGVLRKEVLEALKEYLNCGLLSHGAARAYCDTCKHSMLIAFSCKKRGICPSCSAKRAVVFAEHLYDSVLEKVDHRHVVFSLPKRIRAYFRYDRNLNNILFNAAWGSLSECLGDDTSNVAAVLTLQTAGEALNFNAHLHGAVANGLYLPDGTFKPFENINVVSITESFQNRVLSALHKKELINDGTVEQILSQEYSGFSVWFGEPFQDQDSARFVARYIERGPISLQKLSIQDDIITYTTKNGDCHEFEPLEFLALLTCHLPKKYESITRYYGHYSCRSRGKRAKLLKSRSDIEVVHEPSPPPSKSWAACMKRVLEINPLECPKCKADMRIVAFLKDTREINKIMNSLGIPGPEPPRKIPVTKQTDEFDPLVDVTYEEF